MHTRLAVFFLSFYLAAPWVAAQERSSPGQPGSLQFGAAPVSLPYRANASGTPRFEARIHGQPVQLGLDTGAGWSVITASLAKAVQARPYAGVHPAVQDNQGRAVDGGSAALIDLDIGELHLRDLPVIVVPDARLQAKLLGFTVFAYDGLLGWNALQRLDTEIQPRAGLLVFRPPQPDCAGQALALPDELPRFPVQANGQTLPLLLDTGARVSFLRGRALEQQAEGSTLALTGGAGGAEVGRVGLVPAVQLQVGTQDLTLRDVQRRAGTMDDLVLGMDVLARYTLRIARHCLHLRTE
ncbi:retroviral-like aspartic protease family protein [Massilia sp. TS11]|uniref:retroviral-like aspartic protease family protein n=1 Tax=Massilia sp. TS11 TaxID=2908003 RepID=UPI001EDBE9FF|nr:retroviral-like aspartic protease family protein [Massilia sp. TS11]MCG2584933.1 retroviral-like aspartic protease family protein [Massilia sp. TS11]